MVELGCTAVVCLNVSVLSISDEALEISTEKSGLVHGPLHQPDQPRPLCLMHFSVLQHEHLSSLNCALKLLSKPATARKQ
jgi:hypothetical protein